MDDLTERAIAAAVEVAGRLGLRSTAPQLLRDGSNALVHLKPAPVVARVATTTGLVRQPPETWLQRDVEIATYLQSVGFPVVPPSAEVPPGPHISGEKTGSLALSFWTYIEHEQNREVSPQDAIASLVELHRALRPYRPASSVNVPFMGVVLEEIPHWLKWLEVRHRLSGQDLVELREAQWRLAQRLRPTHTATQVLHGDAHRRNLLRTPAGLVWTDFEDTCQGPVAWDIATFLSQEPGREDELLALYPDAPSSRELLPYIEARELEAVVYAQVLASRFPDRAAKAAQMLGLWQRKRLE